MSWLDDMLGEIPTSRSEARSSRPRVIERSRGCCEICGFFCHPIIELHHVMPVVDGGSGDAKNLIALCPNCHRAATKADKGKANHEVSIAKIMSWAEGSSYHSQESWMKLGALIVGTLVLEGEEWIVPEGLYD